MNDLNIQAHEKKHNTVPATSKNNDVRSTKTKVMMIQYRECLKNHSATLGSYSIDGCGEYMHSTDDGAFLCMACGCHRNFHRKVVDMGGAATSHHTSLPPECHYKCSNTNSIFKNKILVGTQNEDTLRARCGPHNEGPAPTPSENDGGQVKQEVVIMKDNKKRYRTKFTNEQKEKMFGFAEKAGWKMLKMDEELVQQFCQELGIKRRVFKVWMHNNKHLFVRKITNNYTPDDDNDASDLSNK